MYASPESITRAASKQTYYTIRFLVDRDRVFEAYQAYAYFRWLDDQLDKELPGQPERIAFVERQQALMYSCYRGEYPSQAGNEEGMLINLIQNDGEKNSGLRVYIQNMMDVMAFDAHRRGRLISQEELTEYSRCLATAVTEALHYFIGHGCASPRGETRYLAVTGAHITHMLRDALDDNAAGYYNAPREFLETHAIAQQEVDNPAYQAWVKNRVWAARACFEAGKAYLAQVENMRCRLAGYAYIARFEGVLDAIEQEGYRLREDYTERQSLRAGAKLAWSVLWSALNLHRREAKPQVLLTK